MKKSSRRKRQRREAPDSSLVLAPPRPNFKSLFPVVGVGASAGGLEAFSTFLANLPQTIGMAFVLVQHLDPSHSSVLEEILSRKTKIPVHEVSDGVRVEPNHVYIMPANADLTIQDGALRLSPRTVSRGQHRPIDQFLRSLAEDCGDRAISVILSGTASDGTAGCKSVKEVGGITFAQDEATAKYDSMPASAIVAGCIDFVLPPKEIAEELARISKLPYIRRAPPHHEEPLGTESKNGMAGLFALLREAKSVDFSLYKQSTLQRRVKRRMVVNNFEKLPDYLRFVRKNPAELTELYSDLLIPVTNFFRDPGAFDAVRELVLPQIFSNAKQGQIRIWVPGCSTGEEAYSLAMLAMEFWSDHARNSSQSVAPPVQIFATDISDDALDCARAASYPESALTGVSPARLRRFFAPRDGGYQIHKVIRELCVFARQNIAKDPPFSGLDLISCRNLLIYLGAELQKRVIPSLHYALKPSGFLLVGSAESLSAFNDQFTVVDKKFRIYRKKNTGARLITYFTGGDASLRRPADSKLAKVPAGATPVEKETERILHARFVPASIVVNSDLEIVRFRGKTGAFLEPASGQPTFSLAKMAREGLFIDLRAALLQAKKENVAVRKEGVTLQTNGSGRLIDFEVVPIGNPDVGAERFYLIVFQESTRPWDVDAAGRRKYGRPPRKDSGLARQNQRLAREVRQLRDHLQSVIEENEASSEEFKTANEEVLSANEELQSTNEELETTKEELQSSNEELTTLNEEMQNRNTELAVANSDLLNFLANANIPIVMVNRDAHIRRFTPAAQELLSLRPQDLGRPVSEIRGAVEVKNLEEIALQTIETAQIHEGEVRDAQGAWYQLRVRPYKTLDNKIDGAVISLQDISAVKRSLEQMKLYADALIQNAPEPTLLLDPNLRVLVANRSFFDSFRVSRQETEGRLVYELGNNQWNIPALRQLLNRITREDTRIDDFEVRHKFESLGDRIMLLNARRVEPSKGEFLIFLSIHDVTSAKTQLESLQRHAALLNLVHDAIFVRDRSGKIFYWNQGAEEMYGWKKEEALGQTTHVILQTEFPKPFDQIEEDLRRTGRWEGQLVHKHRDGRQLFVDSRWAYLEQAGEGVMLEINTNVSDQKHAQDSLRRLSAYLMNLQDEERRRIARELHDSTGQKLAAAKLQLDTLVKSGNLKAHEKNIAETAQWIDECFQEIRTLSQLLHPPLLDEAGLLSATRWMVDGFSERAKIQVDLKVEGELGRLPQPVELALFRVIQESLSNIRRHSGANKALIRLARTNGRITLEVRDNGKGIPPELLSNSRNRKQVVGVGILGMRERLSQLGGSLEIDSNKSGTTVKVQVPLAAAASH